MQEAGQHWRPPPPLSVGAAQDGPALGQVAGIGRGASGTVWALHRGSRIWDGRSFEGGSGERTAYKEPISEDVVLQLDQETGTLPLPLKCAIALVIFMPC